MRLDFFGPALTFCSGWSGEANFDSREFGEKKRMSENTFSDILFSDLNTFGKSTIPNTEIPIPNPDYSVFPRGDVRVVGVGDMVMLPLRLLLLFIMLPLRLMLDMFELGIEPLPVEFDVEPLLVVDIGVGLELIEPEFDVELFIDPPFDMLPLRDMLALTLVSDEQAEPRAPSARSVVNAIDFII